MKEEIEPKIFIIRLTYFGRKVNVLQIFRLFIVTMVPLSQNYLKINHY